MKWIAALAGLTGFALVVSVWLFGGDETVVDVDELGRASAVESNVIDVAEPPTSRDAAEALTVEPAAPREVVNPVVEAAAPTAADEALGSILAGAIVDVDGHVVDVTGNLTFVDAAGNSEVDRVTRSYARTGLTPGTWYVKTWAFEGYAPREDVVVLEAGVPFTRHDVVLAPTALFDVLALTPDGEPLVAALPGRADLGAVAHVSPPPDVLAASLTRVAYQGVARFSEHRGFGGESKPAGTIGTLAMKQPLPAYVSLTLRNRVLATQFVTEDVDDLRFVIDPSTLDALFGDVVVRVTSADDGSPIAGAQVALNDAQTGGGSKPTDDDGVHVFEQQRPGDLVLTARAEGYEFRCERITVVPDERTTIDIALWPELTLRGTLLAGGEPRGGSLSYTLLDQGVDGFGTWRYSASVGFDGGFEIGRLGRHAYLLRARVDGYPSALFEVDLRGGEVAPVVLEIDAGVDVVFAAAARWSSPADVRIVGPRGHALTSMRDWDGVVPQRRQLEPGSYTAQIEHEDGRVADVAFDVARDGGELRVTLP